MSKKLHRAIQAVRRTLWEIWDPIGVSHKVEAKTEYDSYAPSITGMLLRGCTPRELEAHLARLETDEMGLPDRPPSARSDTITALLALRLETMGGRAHES
jgi:hypothetical protein